MIADLSDDGWLGAVGVGRPSIALPTAPLVGLLCGQTISRMISTITRYAQLGTKRPSRFSAPLLPLDYVRCSALPSWLSLHLRATCTRLTHNPSLLARPRHTGSGLAVPSSLTRRPRSRCTGPSFVPPKGSATSARGRRRSPGSGETLKSTGTRSNR